MKAVIPFTLILEAFRRMLTTSLPLPASLIAKLPTLVFQILDLVSISLSGICAMAMNLVYAEVRMGSVRERYRS